MRLDRLWDRTVVEVEVFLQGCVGSNACVDERARKGTASGLQAGAGDVKYGWR